VRNREVWPVLRLSHVRALLAVLLTALVSVVWLGAQPAAADTIRDQQWQLSFLHASTAWRYSTGKNVTVAVIDSGVDATHPDLIGQVLPGADFVDGSTDGRTDVVGHGTAVAAFIAGRGDDDAGVVGLAYRAKILPIRVLDPRNEYDSAATVAKAVRWAVDHGARVINLSLGSADTATVLSDALDYAFRQDVVVVACDGNLSNDRGAQVWHPAREPGVVAVSGVVNTGTFWAGSLQGPETVLAAPATQLAAAGLDHGYWQVQGTSFGTPMVSATAALIRSRYPTLSAANVVNRLIKTAEDEGPPGRDTEYGYGIVDPVAALTESVPAVSRNPLLTAPVTNQAGSAPSAGPAQAPTTVAPGQVPAGGPKATPGTGVSPLANRIRQLQSRALAVGVAIVAVLLFGAGGIAFALLRRDKPRPGRQGWDTPPR
jgi:serine protease